MAGKLHVVLLPPCDIGDIIAAPVEDRCTYLIEVSWLRRQNAMALWEFRGRVLDCIGERADCNLMLREIEVTMMDEERRSWDVANRDDADWRPGPVPAR